MFRFIFGDSRDPSNSEPFARDGLHGESGIDSIFQHFHSDMQQHMEEIQQQMEDMMKSFGAVEFSSLPNVEFPTSDASGSSNDGSNLRDSMLKTPDAPTLRPPLPIEPPSFRKQDPSFLEAFGLPRLSPFSSHTDEPKIDRDLDGRASDVLKDLESPRCRECPVEEEMPSNSFFSGQSVTIRSIQGPDGKMEQWRTVRDSSGRKEETSTRYVDGKMHTVTHKIDEKGNEEKIEEFKNMDESDLSTFNRFWKNDNNNSIKTDVEVQPEHPADIFRMPQPRQDSYLGSIFSKLFGFRP